VRCTASGELLLKFDERSHRSLRLIWDQVRYLSGRFVLFGPLATGRSMKGAGKTTRFSLRGFQTRRRFAAKIALVTTRPLHGALWQVAGCGDFNELHS
jgi:hypothetical protein